MHEGVNNTAGWGRATTLAANVTSSVQGVSMTLACLYLFELFAKATDGFAFGAQVPGLDSSDEGSSWSSHGCKELARE